MSPIRAVVFDLDRTLVDVQSFTDYGAALADVRRLVAAWPEVRTPGTWWNGPTRACMDVLVSLVGDRRWQPASDTIEVHERAAAGRSVPMPGLGAVLAATARLPRAVVTLLPERTARAVLERHAIPIGVLVPRGAGLAPKPAPDSLQTAAAALGLAGDLGSVLMAGDSAWDLACARGAGAQFVGLRNGRQSEFPAGVETVEDLGELAQRFRS